MKIRKVHKGTCAMLLGTILCGIGTVSAEDSGIEPVHWAYSSFFGTGWYQVEGASSVFVLRVPPRQTLRESGFSSAGDRKIGIDIRYPLTMGFHNIDDIPEIIAPDNFATASFTPGIELEIPISERWYLRPSAHFGWGTDLRNDESAWIYYAGVKSRYQLAQSKFDWFLLNSLYFAGYTPDRGESDRLAVAELGLEVRQPLARANFGGRALDLHWSVLYSFLGNELHFGLPEANFDPIEDQIKVGLALSFRDGPYKLWFFRIHRLGLAYTFSSDGQFKAITLTTHSWFEK